MEKLSISPLWKTSNFQKDELVTIKNLGTFYTGMSFRARVKGVYAWDTYGNPDCYIVQMIDQIPSNPDIVYPNQEYLENFDFRVFTRAVVFSERDLENQLLIES